LRDSFSVHIPWRGVESNTPFVDAAVTICTGPLPERQSGRSAVNK